MPLIANEQRRKGEVVQVKGECGGHEGTTAREWTVRSSKRLETDSLAGTTQFPRKRQARTQGRGHIGDPHRGRLTGGHGSKISTLAFDVQSGIGKHGARRA